MSDLNHVAEVIIKKIESGCAEILSLCRGVPIAVLREPLLANGWSVKDAVAHIAAWVWRCAFLLKQARDTNGPLLAKPDVIALNTEFYQERQSWNWAKVKLDFRQAHFALFDVIRELPPQRLNHTLVQKTIARETWEHCAQHLADLGEWRRQVVGERRLFLT